MCKWSLLQGKAYIVHLCSGPDACWLRTRLLLLLLLLLSLLLCCGPSGPGGAVFHTLVPHIQRHWISGVVFCFSYFCAFVLWTLRALVGSVSHICPPYTMPLYTWRSLLFFVFLVHLRSGLLPQEAFIIRHMELFC